MKLAGHGGCLSSGASQTILNYSDEESKFFEMNIGRSVLSELNEGRKGRLIEEIERGKYDVLRIRVDESHSRTAHILHNLGYPCVDLGTIVKYELAIEGLQYSEYVNSEVSLRVYSGQDPESIEHIMRNGAAENPIGYCSTPSLTSLVSRDQELEYLTSYYSKLFLTPERQLWFIEWEREPVAFVASTFADGVMDTPLAVVTPKFRGKKLLHEIMISRNNYGIEHSLKTITNGARDDSLVSQHVFSKFGMRVIGRDRVFHLTPLLSYNPRTLETS